MSARGGEQFGEKLPPEKRPLPVVLCPVCEQRFVDTAGCNIHIGKVHVEQKPTITERLDAIEARLLRVEHQFSPIAGGTVLGGPDVP